MDKPRQIIKHIGKGAFTVTETNTNKMTDTQLADIANFIRMRKRAIKQQDDFNRGMNHAYQDILFLVEDMLADDEFPIKELLTKNDK